MVQQFLLGSVFFNKRSSSPTILIFAFSNLFVTFDEYSKIDDPNPPISTFS